MGNLGLDWLRGSEASAGETGPNRADQTALDDNSLSFVLGGLLYQLYLRTKLLRSPIGLVRRRVSILIAICWLPLPILLFFTEGASALLSFLSDVAVQINLLVALPLLIGAEVFAYRRLPDLVRQFIVRGIIAPKDRPRFERLVASILRLRNSITIEVCLLLAAFTLGHLIWMSGPAKALNQWVVVKQSQAGLSAAGLWYAFLSLPILRFLLLRWYFRIFLWYRFLWHVKAFPLQLNLFHPDRAAGLGFLTESMFAFAPVLMAQTVGLAGMIANRIFLLGAKAPEFETEIAGALLFLMLVVMMPLGFFSAALIAARHAARHELGALSSRYVDAFRRKWIESNPGEPLLGSPDIQSLADLGNAFNTAADMRIVPFGAKSVMRLAFLVAAPLAPLALTIVPFERAVKGLVKLVL